MWSDGMRSGGRQNVQIVWMELAVRDGCYRQVFGNRGNSLPRASR
jgi:hypothetical protein